MAIELQKILTLKQKIKKPSKRKINADLIVCIKTEEDGKFMEKWIGERSKKNVERC